MDVDFTSVHRICQGNTLKFILHTKPTPTPPFNVSQMPNQHLGFHHHLTLTSLDNTDGNRKTNGKITMNKG